MTKKRVLIVEDQVATSLEEHQILRDLGFEVVGIAFTGEDAIRRARAEKPDLILMDIKLLGDMDGREAAFKIRESYQVPVIYVTGIGDKETSKSRNFTLPEGIGYIVKPFTKKELESEIKRLLG